jgi:hypothetical protein
MERSVWLLRGTELYTLAFDMKVVESLEENIMHQMEQPGLRIGEAVIN